MYIENANVKKLLRTYIISLFIKNLYVDKKVSLYNVSIFLSIYYLAQNNFKNLK